MGEIMTEVQFTAMAQLLRRLPTSPSYHAVKDVFVHGLTAKAAAKKHALEYTSVSDSCASFRKGLRLCYTVITGEKPCR